MMSSTEWMLIVAGLAFVAVLAFLWRGAESRAAAVQGDQAKTAAELEDVKARLARETQARKKQAEELSTYRKRADKTKKRQAKGVPDKPLGTASRIGDLEAELERSLRERKQGQAEREQLAAQVSQLQARLEVSTRAAESARAQSAVAAPVVAKVPVPASSPLEAQVAEQSERIAKLENELDLAKVTSSRTRKRMSNQEQLYASVRAELDVKKDRLRTQEEQIQRLQALNAVGGD